LFDILKTLAPLPVIGILRADTADGFLPASEVLYASGFRCLEFTMTTQDALNAVEAVRATLPDDLVVGVGTVRTEQHVKEAVDAGAHFLVSQVYRPHLVEAARGIDVPFIPGALTPTEILDAWEGGVPAVKISPIGPVGGVDYLQQVRAPLPEVPIVPTGGVDPADLVAYLDAGAVAVGLSGSFIGDALEPGGDLDALSTRAREAIRAVTDR
jgi:2-dehydro-3-deoxyphosphogluconate aldolase / (4S)-4-hydroxy-2-oxoglutarate aldolase